MRPRIRFTMIWTVNPQQEGFPFDNIDTFKKWAERSLITGVSHYEPTVSYGDIQMFGTEMADIPMTWEINQDLVPGMFHTPDSHIGYATRDLVTFIRAFTHRLKVVKVEGVRTYEDGQQTVAPWTDMTSHSADVVVETETA